MLSCSVLREAGAVVTIANCRRTSLSRVVVTRGRLKKHESGARPAKASLIDAGCWVNALAAAVTQLPLSSSPQRVVEIRARRTTVGVSEQLAVQVGRRCSDGKALRNQAYNVCTLAAHDTRAADINSID